MSESRREGSPKIASKHNPKGISRWFDLLFIIVATLAITAVFLVLAQMAFAA